MFSLNKLAVPIYPNLVLTLIKLSLDLFQLTISKAGINTSVIYPNYARLNMLLSPDDYMGGPFSQTPLIILIVQTMCSKNTDYVSG